MKQILDAAIKLKKRETGEVITYAAIAAVIWADSNPASRANSMSTAMRTGINKREHIFKLSELFPETSLEVWINPDACSKYLQQIKDRYSVKMMDENKELQNLYTDLLYGMLPQKQLFKWLNY